MPPARTRQDPRVADVLTLLDRFAPFNAAADWDNVGLLAGRPDWPASRALLTIDLTDAVAREALARRADLVLAYHPPIFKGLRAVTPRAEAPTTLLADLLSRRVSVVALHTALDAAPGGTNDVLLDALDCTSRRPLEPLCRETRSCKLTVFLPAEHVPRVRGALSAAGAGAIGRYSECSFELAGHGTFRGDETTTPAVGDRLRLERVNEVRLEMLAPRDRLGEIVRALYAVHPYEEPAFDLYPLVELADRGQAGIGRVGALRRRTTGHDLLKRLARRVDLSAATTLGNLRRRFASVTAAAGSFAARSLRDPQSLVVTGELKHHDALDLLKHGVSAVCVGHWASERPALTRVAEWLTKHAPGVRAALSRADRPPLTPA